MININSVLNGEKLEYSKNWNYNNITYQLYITAKQLILCEIDNKYKPYYSIRSSDLGVCGLAELLPQGMTINSATSTVSSLDNFRIIMWNKEHKIYLVFDFPGTDEGQKTAEEVYQSIVKVINGLK